VVFDVDYWPCLGTGRQRFWETLCSKEAVSTTVQNWGVLRCVISS